MGESHLNYITFDQEIDMEESHLDHINFDEENNTSLNEQEVHFEYELLNNGSATRAETASANRFADSWMTPTAVQELNTLLQKWNFAYLLPVFCDECIDVNALKIMKPYQLMKIGKKWELKWGIQIKFESILTSWQKSIVTSTRSEEQQNCSINNTMELYDNEPNIYESVKGHSQISLDVENILKSSSQGRIVLGLYENNSKLNEGSRIVIVDLLINYMIQNDIHMTVVLAKQTAEAIINVFKTEFLGYYYTKQRGKKPQGKIYDKYFNAIRKLKNNGILEKKRPYAVQSLAPGKKRIVHLGSPELNVNQSIDAILLDNCSWGEIESHWAATKNYRLSETTNAQSTTAILEKWKQYKKPMGFKLIDMDFKHLYPNAGSLAVNFEIFALKIIPIFEDRIKDQESKLIFQKMKEMANITENGRCFGILYLMHCILVPSAKLVKCDGYMSLN